MIDVHQLIFKQIQEERNALLEHPLYQSIQSDEDLRLFMELHVYAVWDFMSLLKALQQQLTCTQTPWMPVGDPDLRYLINEIVLAEETDIDIDGNRKSHYEMYIDAMESIGMETQPTHDLIQLLAKSENILSAIKSTSLPDAAKQFLTSTFEIIQGGKPHEIAAAFTYGREDLIPEMFTEILEGMHKSDLNVNLKPVQYYFDRHIELDGDEHGPMAHKMVALLCDNDQVKIEEAARVASKALASRIRLFNGILSNIQEKKGVMGT
ncbi:DUF3050 domain-containing protein [Nonlabens xiamenensis]|uniref:DUF3050 domain-containing protein n=1 Tax=Nonlabens xiamenensis TaxID=2341043 RepID=UPI000F6049E9|nr:DUF3050 domain-containing protein [Nonlabens xiamenensis]